MPLKLLRGAPRRAAAPPRLAGTDEESLTRAYLDLFAREARWPERRAETGLLGLEDGVSTEVSLRIAVRAASIYLRSHEAEIVLLVPEETRLEAGFTTQLESYIAQRYTGGGGRPRAAPAPWHRQGLCRRAGREGPEPGGHAEKGGRRIFRDPAAAH